MNHICVVTLQSVYRTVREHNVHMGGSGQKQIITDWCLQWGRMFVCFLSLMCWCAAQKVSLWLYEKCPPHLVNNIDSTRHVTTKVVLSSLHCNATFHTLWLERCQMQCTLLTCHSHPFPVGLPAVRAWQLLTHLAQQPRSTFQLPECSAGCCDGGKTQLTARLRILRCIVLKFKWR